MDWTTRNALSSAVLIPALPRVINRNDAKLCVRRQKKTGELQVKAADPGAYDINGAAQLHAWLRHVEWAIYPFKLNELDIDMTEPGCGADAAQADLHGRLLRNALGACLEHTFAAGDHKGIGFDVSLHYTYGDLTTRAWVGYGSPGHEAAAIEYFGIGWQVLGCFGPLWESIAETVTNRWLLETGVTRLSALRRVMAD